jgi:hypothetical protein
MKAELHLPIPGAAEGLGLTPPPPGVRPEDWGLRCCCLRIALEEYTTNLIDALAKVHHFSVAISEGEGGLSVTVEEGEVTVEGPDEEIERLLRIGVLCPTHPGEWEDDDDGGPTDDGPDGRPALHLLDPSDN